VHAFRDIKWSNGWLLVCSGVHLALAAALVQAHGALGLILADGANMLLRIAYCLRFVARHFADVRSHGLASLFPQGSSLLCLGLAMACVCASNWIFFVGLGAAEGSRGEEKPRVVPPTTGEFLPRAASHIMVGALSLVAVVAALSYTERELLKYVAALRKGEEA
jgi:oligosaccharide translocation protein RFT1